MQKIAIILARGNSQRIKNKNIKMFLNKPMIYWPIKAAKKSKLFDKILVSTDSDKIKKISIKYGAEVPFYRSKKNSSNKALPDAVIDEVLSKLKVKYKKTLYICVFFANSPFTYYKDIIKGFRKIKNHLYNTVLPVVKVDSRFQRIYIKNKKTIVIANKKFQKFRSQDLKDTFIDAGQWFWIRKSNSKKTKVLSGKLSYVEIPNNRFCDIDNLKDLKKAKDISKKLKFLHV